jgi:hypothetical protein
MNDAIEAKAVSEAERIMTAAGWRRTVGASGLAVWRIDHEGEDHSLITADGNADADPLAIVWTCGRYRSEGGFSACLLDPIHRNLAQSLAIVATLQVQDEPEQDAPIAVTAALSPDRFFPEASID